MTVDWRSTLALTPAATRASWHRNTLTLTLGVSTFVKLNVLSIYFLCSARPCHTHPGQQCVAPWHTPLVYGLLLPWVTIAISAIMWTILLCWDYNKSRGLFTHLVPYTSVSQTENTSQRNQQPNNQR